MSVKVILQGQNKSSTSADDIDSGTLSSDRLPVVPIAKGGTGLTSSPSLLTNLGSTSTANILTASPRPGITGTLAISHGGTGLTSSPSMLTNLASTTAASILAASPRPGVTGTLPVANGGTGNTSVDSSPTSGSTKMVTSGGVYTALSSKLDTSTSRTANTVYAAPNGSAGAASFRSLVAADIPDLPASKITSGTLPLTRGGTGVTSLDSLKTVLGISDGGLKIIPTLVFQSSSSSSTFPYVKIEADFKPYTLLCVQMSGAGDIKRTSTSYSGELYYRLGSLSSNSNSDWSANLYTYTVTAPITGTESFEFTSPYVLLYRYGPYASSSYFAPSYQRNGGSAYYSGLSGFAIHSSYATFTTISWDLKIYGLEIII